MKRINIVFACLFIYFTEPLLFHTFECYYMEKLAPRLDLFPNGNYVKYTSKIDSMMTSDNVAQIRNTTYCVEYKGETKRKLDYPHEYQLTNSPWTYNFICGYKGHYFSYVQRPVTICSKEAMSSDEEIKVCLAKSYQLFRDSVSEPTDGSYDEVYDRFNNALKHAPNDWLSSYGDRAFLHETHRNIEFDKYCVIVSEGSYREISPYMELKFYSFKKDCISITNYLIMAIIFFLFVERKYKKRNV